MSNRKVALIILDGYGIGEPNAGNAIYMAKTPVMDGLLQRWPHTKLSASGLDVGLPDGQMGNSEVGHTNIGSGRVVFQDLPRITNAISDGSFFENPVYGAALDNAANGKALHILGLLSDGGVHSHIRHIFAMVKMAHDRGIERVYLHCFLDGRDVAPTSGAGYVRQLRDYCAELGTGKIATLQGRFYGMDRDKRWDRIESSYNAMVCGEGVQDPDPIHAVEASYAAGVTDEFVKPVVCVPDGKICSGDSVIFMNFRPDRAREMTYALTQSDFDGFARKVVAQDLHYVCTTRYDEKLTDLPIAFPPEELHDTLGEIVSAHGLRQLRIAETEKYAALHMTPQNVTDFTALPGNGLTATRAGKTLLGGSLRELRLILQRADDGQAQPRPRRAEAAGQGDDAEQDADTRQNRECGARRDGALHACGVHADGQTRAVRAHKKHDAHRRDERDDAAADRIHRCAVELG